MKCCHYSGFTWVYIMCYWGSNRKKENVQVTELLKPTRLPCGAVYCRSFRGWGQGFQPTIITMILWILTALSIIQVVDVTGKPFWSSPLHFLLFWDYKGSFKCKYPKLYCNWMHGNWYFMLIKRIQIQLFKITVFCKFGLQNFFLFNLS